MKLPGNVVGSDLELGAAGRASFQIVRGEELDVIEQAIGIDGRCCRADRDAEQQDCSKNSTHQAPRAVSSRTRSRVLSAGTRVWTMPREARSAGTAPIRLRTPNSPPRT